MSDFEKATKPLRSEGWLNNPAQKAIQFTMKRDSLIIESLLFFFFGSCQPKNAVAVSFQSWFMPAFLLSNAVT
jgi:hypothetical protein